MRALAFGLVPDDAAAAVSPTELVELVRDAGTHLGTGFLATPYLLPVLADHGHLDVAYELLFQDTEPSWLVMIDRGATTIWEQWDGVDADGVPHESLNHYSKGAVISFLHRYVAGLQRLEPTYRRFRVAPRPGGGLTWAQARPRVAARPDRGRVASRGDELALDLTVPPGCSAEVVLPDGTTTRPGRRAPLRLTGCPCSSGSRHGSVRFRTCNVEVASRASAVGSATQRVEDPCAKELVLLAVVPGSVGGPHNNLAADDLFFGQELVGRQVHVRAVR